MAEFTFTGPGVLTIANPGCLINADIPIQIQDAAGEWHYYYEGKSIVTIEPKAGAVEIIGTGPMMIVYSCRDCPEDDPEFSFAVSVDVDVEIIKTCAQLPAQVGERAAEQSLPLDIIETSPLHESRLTEFIYDGTTYDVEPDIVLNAIGDTFDGDYSPFVQAFRSEFQSLTGESLASVVDWGTATLAELFIPTAGGTADLSLLTGVTMENFNGVSVIETKADGLGSLAENPFTTLAFDAHTIPALKTICYDECEIVSTSLSTESGVSLDPAYIEVECVVGCCVEYKEVCEVGTSEVYLRFEGA